jgi:hypothetical protein
MDRETLEKLKLYWRVEILQNIATNAYVAAFSVLLGSPVSPQESAPKAAFEDALRRLSKEMDEKQDQLYQAFFSDPSVPESDRALFAEELAHLMEEMKSSMIPPLPVKFDQRPIPKHGQIKTTKRIGWSAPGRCGANPAQRTAPGAQPGR